MLKPHNVTRESDGTTFFYSGRAVMPLYAARADGTGYFGLGVQDTPEVRRLIGEAARRVYAPRRKVPVYLYGEA